MTNENPVIKKLEQSIPGAVKQVIAAYDEIGIVVDKKDLTKVCTLLKNDAELAFDLLSDLAGMDYQGKRDKRFELVYQLYSTRTHQRLRVKTELAENEPAPTVTGIWKAAEWPERECHEMFGIDFEGHPDLMRLLTIEEFDGFPLRKDFPLLGKAEIISGHEGGVQWQKRD